MAMKVLLSLVLDKPAAQENIDRKTSARAALTANAANAIDVPKPVSSVGFLAAEFVRTSLHEAKPLYRFMTFAACGPLSP